MARAVPDINVPFRTVPTWVRAAARCGFNIEPIFRALDIRTDLLHMDSGVIPLATLDQLFERCIRATRRGHFPFVMGDAFAFDFMPELETFLSTSRSLREATQALGWVREIVSPYVDLHLQEEGAIAKLVIADPPRGFPPAKPYHSESSFASVIRFVRLLMGSRPVQPRILRFKHAPPAYAEIYEPFFQVPVAFNQPGDALEFDRGLLDLRLEGDFPSLHLQAALLVEQRMSRMPQRQGVAGGINELFTRRPELLTASIEKTAAALKLHPRNLQRQLQSEQTRFADLQSEARFRAALDLMRNTQDLEQISEQLGFSDRRSFTRAFKRWSGMTPTAFRRSL